MTDDIEVEVLTGNVTLTIYDTSDKPIKNARVALINSNTDSYVGFSDWLGECLITDVIYGEYNVIVTRTGYEPQETTITLDEQTLTETITLTHQPIDPNQVEVDLDETYTFTLREQVNPEYAMSAQISNWLKTNLESLKDDLNHSVFGRVNLGFSDESLRTFGKKPVCDVYIDNIEYTTDFDNQAPEKVNSFVLFYLKGVNSSTYTKACELHDLLMQEFLTNEEWKRCSVVRGTSVTNSELRIQPLNKKWGVIGAFQLSHYLY